MTNSQWECFVGTKVWFRTCDNKINEGVVRKVENNTFYIRIPGRVGVGSMLRIHVDNVFESKESLLADDYKIYCAELKKYMKLMDTPEKLLKVMYGTADAGDVAKFAMRRRAKEFFGIELDEEAAAKEREIDKILEGDD